MVVVTLLWQLLSLFSNIQADEAGTTSSAKPSTSTNISLEFPDGRWRSSLPLRGTFAQYVFTLRSLALTWVGRYVSIHRPNFPRDSGRLFISTLELRPESNPCSLPKRNGALEINLGHGGDISPSRRCNYSMSQCTYLAEIKLVMLVTGILGAKTPTVICVILTWLVFKLPDK